MMYEPPAVARLNDNAKTNVVIFGNGFTGAGVTLTTERKAALYVVNAETGAVIKTIAVGSGYTGSKDNGYQTTGLGAVTLVAGSDGQLAYAYAGDLRGNLWRFDLNNWSARLVATVSIADGILQSILAAPEVAQHPEKGRIVYFGTGRRRPLTNDEVDTSQQSFYAVRDQDGVTITRSNLFRYHINGAPVGASLRGVDSKVVNVVGSGTFNWRNFQGWMLDLQTPKSAPPGNAAQPSERVLFSPMLVAGDVVFTTVLPLATPCDSGVANYQYVLTAFSGRPALNDIAITQPNTKTPLCYGKSCGGISVGTGSVPLGVNPMFGKIPPPDKCDTPGQPACPVNSCPSGKPLTSNGIATACAKDGISQWFQMR